MTTQTDGLMQDWALTADKILTSAAAQFPDTRIVVRREGGDIGRSNYAELEQNARRIAHALHNFGISGSDRVATLMWNNYHHLLTWYGVMGMGAVLHTLNPRLHSGQLAWIINDAKDRILVIEKGFTGLIGEIADKIPSVELILIATDDVDVAPIGNIPTKTLMEFAGGVSPDTVWGGFDENRAGSLCYTSGTTGNPKGVLYSHRSNFLHALVANQTNAFGLSAMDVVMPIVPMFHANAWGLPFIAPMAGAALVMPGSRLDGGSVLELIEQEGVTFTAGVPTVLQDVLRIITERGSAPETLRRIVIGGSAVSTDMVRAFDAFDIRVIHGWGMTEMSPLGAISMVLPDEAALGNEEKLARRCRQGRTVFGVEAKIVDEAGKVLPNDNKAAGALLVRGPAVVKRYFNHQKDAVDADGFFDTGDIAKIDEHGFIQLVDRSKDVIKSGGEWISSIALEDALCSHPSIRRAAALARSDEKWGERPIVILEVEDDDPLGTSDVIEHLRPLIPKWWLPDAVGFAQLPLGATGKIDKMKLRAMLDGSEGPELIPTVPVKKETA